MAKLPASRLNNPVLPESPDVTASPEAAVFAASNGSNEYEEKEKLLENADRKAIDDIILSEDIQKGGKIRLERRGINDQEYAYLVAIPAEAWNTERSIEWVKQQFGGGDYRCRTFRANGQMYKPFTFRIDHRIRGKLDEDEMRRLGDKGNDLNQRVMDLIAKPTDNNSAQMMQMFEMSNRKSDQMFMMMMQMNAESQKTMATVMAAALTRQSGGIDPVILELLKSSNKPVTPMIELVETMKMLKELTNNQPDEDKQPDDMMSKITRMISAGAPLLSTLVGGGAQPVAGQVPVQSMPPSNLPVQDPRIAQLNNQLRMLISAAEKNSDPSIYADLITDMLPPDQFTGLVQHLTRQDWCVILLGNEAVIAHVRPWFDELRQMILSNANTNSTQPAAPAATNNGAGLPVASQPE